MSAVQSPPAVADLEPCYSPEEIAKVWRTDPSNVRKIFSNEAGVINISRGKKHKTIRVPRTVYDRVLRQRELG